MQLFNKYQVWVVNTASKAELYLWDNWKHLYPLVDKLVSLSPAKAFIRTRQAAEYKNKWLGFGRMSWSKDNNAKWTRRYRENESEGSSVRFFDTEIWARDWNQVDKTGIFPDVYVRLFNEPGSQITKEGLIVAIRRSIADKNTAAIQSVLADIAKRIPDSTSASVTRSWGPGSGFVNHIQDMNNYELELIVKGHVKPSLMRRLRSLIKSKKIDS